MTFQTNTPEETEALGERLAAQLRPGDVVAYRGGLGAGKTAFTRGLARGLGVREPVISPTYTIVNEYRLRSADDLFDIGWEDYLAEGGVCAVEWSENVEDALGDPITVTLTGSGDGPRTITIDGWKGDD